ncbi:MAG TPA: LPS assembly lipoprotein LptE [Gemmatimonadales bacterium]|nr:LPS assembly lipoprotein LptE [Gemmatimonadales bacterium]
MRRIPGLALLLLSASTLSLGACLYKFSGGGLPANIRTVAVVPFDNLTPEPVLTQEITQAVREAVERRLGLRQAGETQADALVTGIVRRYDPDLPVTFTGQPDNKVEVTKRMVQISVDVKIMDQKANKVLWERNGLLVQGEYDPNQEAQGRKKALEKLITDIVEGAQSQW